MYHARPGLVIGFHGCDLSVCNRVVQRETNLRPGTNSYDWLGSGVYFWENNRQRALEFVSECMNNRVGNQLPNPLSLFLELI